MRRSRWPPASREGPRAALWAGHTSVRARRHWPGGPGVCGRGGARRRARSWSRLKGAARRRWASSAGSASPASWLCAAASRGSSAGGRTRGCGCPGGRTRWRWWAPRSPGGRWAPGRAGPGRGAAAWRRAALANASLFLCLTETARSGPRPRYSPRRGAGGAAGRAR